MLDKQPCYSYGWFPIVALQRIHDLHWLETKKARAALCDVKTQRRKEPEQWKQQTLDAIADVAPSPHRPATAAPRDRRRRPGPDPPRRRSPLRRNAGPRHPRGRPPAQGLFA